MLYYRHPWSPPNSPDSLNPEVGHVEEVGSNKLGVGSYQSPVYTLTRDSTTGPRPDEGWSFSRSSACSWTPSRSSTRSTGSGTSSRNSDVLYSWSVCTSSQTSPNRTYRPGPSHPDPPPPYPSSLRERIAGDREESGGGSLSQRTCLKVGCRSTCTQSWTHTSYDKP